MAKRAKRRNLLFLHLEAISQNAFNQYRKELLPLWRLADQSAYFRRFNVSGINTVSFLSDVFYGSNCVLDQFTSYRGSITHENVAKAFSPYYERNLAELFAKKGYAAAYVIEHPMLAHTYTAPGIQIGESPSCPVVRPATSEATRHYITDWLDRLDRSGQPFFLYHHDFSAGVSIVFPEPALSLGTAIARQHALFGENLSWLLGMLEDRGELENTVIVAGGDHSSGFVDGPHLQDYFACRGSSMPFSYAGNTPLLIYNGDLARGVHDQLVSSSDLYAYILRAFFPDEPLPENIFPFPWCDISSGERRIAYSQNRFAFQSDYNTYHNNEIQIPKGYAASDGEYRLVLAEDPEQPRRLGVGFYLEQSDPGNAHNLLRYFKLDDWFNLIAMNYPKTALDRFMFFWCYLSPMAVEDMMKKYAMLRQSLVEHIRTREEYARRAYLPDIDYSFLDKTSFYQL